MEVSTEPGAPNVVHASGQIDVSNSARFCNELEHASRDSPLGLIVDLSEVKYIDSAGIQALIFVYKRIRESAGMIVLIVTGDAVRRIFDIVQLDAFPGFEITDGRESAERIIRREDGLSAA